MVSNPLFVKMINQLKMIKRMGMMCVVGWKTKVNLRLVRKFGQPEAMCNWGQPSTLKILWLALSNFKLMSAF